MRWFLGLALSCAFLFGGVELNNAGENELAKLKGIGVAKAKEIIAYRDANGCFQSIDELIKVKGIGAKTIEKNKETLTLGECKK
jgi:competence protein ComEA